MFESSWRLLWFKRMYPRSWLSSCWDRRYTLKIGGQDILTSGSSGTESGHRFRYSLLCSTTMYVSPILTCRVHCTRISEGKQFRNPSLSTPNWARFSILASYLSVSYLSRHCTGCFFKVSAAWPLFLRHLTAFPFKDKYCKSHGGVLRHSSSH